MRLLKLPAFLAALIIIGVVACKQKASKKATSTPVIFKGLYSLGPDAKTFKNCSNGHEYWVTDATNTLELKYWEIIPHETPDAPVYIEVEGGISGSVKQDDGGHGDSVGYDSMLVVKKIIKISKDIPAGMCTN